MLKLDNCVDNYCHGLYVAYKILNGVLLLMLDGQANYVEH